MVRTWKFALGSEKKTIVSFYFSPFVLEIHVAALSICCLCIRNGEFSVSVLQIELRKYFVLRNPRDFTFAKMFLSLLDDFSVDFNRKQSLNV